jgi:hypothetical protein
MKTLFIALATMTLLTSHAMANEMLTIQCYFKDQPLFGIYIEAGPFNGYIDDLAPAQITIGGPRLHLPYSATLNRTTINTRITAGTSYYAKLDQNSSISLKDIGWVNPGTPSNASFTGVYAHKAGKTALVCK